ncbi:hypothetical protein BKA70DRAFT_1466017 [Coprinopsis sp. MPI-PUGE-AT-0042]|nr:hypothetical protein BKA70DRAFT_1466017 [Coprinopsis sp. MPI-PUGE-AT-0042]
MSNLFHQTIQRARAGSGKCLEELSLTLTTENYTLAVLDAALENLHLEDLPKRQPLSLVYDRLQRALSAVGLVYCCLARCAKKTTLAASTTSRIQEHFEGLREWMSLTIKGIGDNFAYTIVASLILEMGIHDDSLYAMVYSSPRILNLTLKLWHREPPIGDHVLDYLAERSVPPPTLLIDAFLTHQEGSQIFCDIVASSKRQLSTFLDVLLLKVKHLTSLLQQRSTNFGICYKNAHTLTLIFNRVDRQAVSHRMKRCACLKALVDLTSIFASRISPSADLLESSSYLLQIAKCNRRLDLIIDSGLLEGLVKLYPDCDWGDEGSQHSGKRILTVLASSACYPRVLKSLANVTSRTRVLLVELSVEAESNLWSCLVQHITTLSSILKSVKFDILNCNNDCPFSSRMDNLHPPVKICTGCHFMTYCSVNCQKDDWLRRHRFECTELGLRTQGYYGTARVSQYAISFYLSVAMNLFHDPRFKEACEPQISPSSSTSATPVLTPPATTLIAKISQYAKSLSLSIANILLHDPVFKRLCNKLRSITQMLKNSIVTLDMTYREFPQTLLRVRTCDEWVQGAWKEGVCPSLESRVTSLIEEARKYDSGILEFILEWDAKHYVSLLIRFEETGVRWYTPVRSVMRILQITDPGEAYC